MSSAALTEAVLCHSPFPSDRLSEFPSALRDQTTRGGLDILLSLSSTSSRSPHLSVLPSVPSARPQGSPRPRCCPLSLSCVCSGVSEGNVHLPLQVFQRRNTGQLDFFKRWRTYVEGFGDPMREFWLGMTFEHP